ncbi:MAG: ImmA/IrrE family metallo-endopeptidase [Bacteroidales bacterium]|jgi:Zn-dependent peptidase ImmA (M78 family)
MKNNLNEYRKEELSDLAESIIDNYFGDRFIEPEVIARANNITYSYGNYKNAFDGLLQHKFGRFHIFINSYRSGLRENPRARFTFGHELGHFYIDEHRNPLKSGKVMSHPSFNLLLQENFAEKEADFFSSCLLMPTTRFRKSCLKNPLSGKLLEKLSNEYQTSVSATIFRYFELNLYPMFIVCCKDAIVKWYFRSVDFKYKYPPAIGSEVPHSSVAGEYFYSNKEYLSEEIIFPDDWFSDFKMDKTQQIFEKCYYIKHNNSVISLIWNK